MAVDFSTTHYALSNNLGYEGNGFMSGIVSNPIQFILIKLIGTMVIIFMTNICLERNKKVAFIGMRLIIFMMLFVVANNLMIISASALSFSNLSVGGTGSINTANGYFDNPESAFGYTGTRNVYVITEDTQINIIEPISWAGGSSPTTYLAINSSLGTLKDGVVHNGYLYFVDGTTLKKKKTRDFETSQSCESTDTAAPSGCIIVVSTGVGETLRVLDNVLYFTKGTNSLHHLDSLDNEVTDFSLTYPPGASAAQFAGFTVFKSSGTLTIYYAGWVVGSGTVYTIRCTSASCTPVTNIIGANQALQVSAYTTQSFYYLYVQSSGGNIQEEHRYISNNTNLAVDYITSSLFQANRIYVGGQSTVGVLVSSATTYETFNSDQVGVDSVSTTPPELTYDTKTISSLDTTYYNRSDIYLQYNVILDSLNANNLLLDFDDYRWMISMTDPNGVTTDIIQSPACSYSSILDTTCQVDSTMGIHAPSNGWLEGSWTAKLYEINTVDSNRALITTSTAFTVLNTSLENQSIPPPPFTPPTAGTAPQAVTLIDGFVSWLGLGVNSVSKLLFAMIIIAIAATVGLYKGNGNIAMVFAFVPYAFFMFIDYIPKWIFIITIILIAIASKAFR